MCRKKKIKCDGKMPSCSHCINYKTECIFTQVEKKRNPPKGYAARYKLPPFHALTEAQRKIYRRPGEPSRPDGGAAEALWSTGRGGR